LTCRRVRYTFRMIKLEQGEALLLRGRNWLQWLARQINYWGRMIYQAARDVINPDTPLIASSISYYTLISIFPLLLLSVAIASRWFDPMWVESEIVTQMEFVAPAIGDLLGQNMESIVRARGPVSGFSVLVLAWSASNVFNILTRTMDRLWEIKKRRTFWRQRGLAIILVLFLSALLLIASTVQGTLVTIVNALYPDQLRALRPYTNDIWATLLSIILFGELYRLLPHRTLSWADVLPGAIVAGVVWELLKRAFLAFINVYLSRSNLVYGSVATIFVFLNWTYFSSIIFLFGAYLNVANVRSREKEAG
jgi:membrane protein